MGEFPLYAEIPLHDVIARWIELQIGGAERRCLLYQRNRAAGERSGWKRGDAPDGLEWRGRDLRQVELICERQNVEHAEPGPHRRLAVAERVPRHPDSRLEIRLRGIFE